MNTATNTRSATGSIELDATPEQVWNAITDAAELIRWFPLEARVEPGEGGTLYMSWKNEYAGESKIIAWEPLKRFAAEWGWGDDSDMPAQVNEYRIEARGRTTVLHVVTSGFPDDPSWDGYVEATNRGWMFELQSLKQYIENHLGEDRDVVYLRRRTPISADEAWERIFGDAGLGENPLGGTVFDDTPEKQYAAVVDEGLFRVSFEPCGHEIDEREVCVWLQAWGDDRAKLPGIEAKWRPMLEGLFPEGRWME